MEEIKNIQEAIGYVQQKMPTLNKDASNPYAKSKYVTLDNILKHLMPIASEIGLVIMQNPITPDVQNPIIPANVSIEKGNGNNTQVSSQVKNYAYIQIETRLYFKGEELVFKSYIQPIELAGNLPQIFGSAVTYLKRYQLVALFGIATGEDDDAVFYNQPNMYQQQPYNNQQTKPQPQKVDLDQLNQMITKYAERNNLQVDTVTRNILQSQKLQRLEDMNAAQYKTVAQLLQR